MADQKTSAPKPPVPKPASAASVQIEPVAAKKDGFDLMRPVRYASGFVSGTFKHTLDNMSNLGRKGSRIGAVLGAIVMFSGAIATGGLELIAIGWLAGLAAGAVAGGATGLIGGGIRGMDRETRKEKYADDLMRKARSKGMPRQQVDYRDAHREYKQRSEYTLDRYFQQDREIQADDRRYFQDRVNHSRSQGWGSGQGF